MVDKKMPQNNDLNGIMIQEPELQDIDIDQIIKEHNQRIEVVNRRFRSVSQVSEETLHKRFTV